VRILFASNYYPPADRGGYEQWCAEVAAALVERGHQVGVLTGQAEAASNDDAGVRVYRTLQLEVVGGVGSTLLRAGPLRRRIERANAAAVQGAVADLQPEVVLLWGMWNVPRSVPARLEQLLPGRVAYYLCDYWPSLPSAWAQQLDVPARHSLTGLPKRLLARPVLASLAAESRPTLRLQHVYCVSRAVQRALIEAGLPLEHAEVIYGGTTLGDHRPEAVGSAGLRLLYAGRLTRDKGVHTGIQALGLLSAAEREGLSLDIVGRGDHDYERGLQQLVREHGLERQVRFCGAVARAQMPSVFFSHHALLLLSEWAEPFARVVLEGMAAGLVVVGTATGGTPELLADDLNGLTFPPGDAAALAAQIRRLRQDPDLRARLASAGLRAVRQHLSFPHMVDQIEAGLNTIATATERKTAATPDYLGLEWPNRSAAAHIWTR
jgi:glycogen synthase